MARPPPPLLGAEYPTEAIPEERSRRVSCVSTRNSITPTAVSGSDDGDDCFDLLVEGSGGACTPSTRLTLTSTAIQSDDACERPLPFGWCKLVSDAYRDVTGRPVVDRVRLLETSSAPGRSPDMQVYWIHTMIRWADLRLIESERCPERGEDLTLFVLHSWLEPDCPKAMPNGQRRSIKGNSKRPSAKNKWLWKVASVRVLNSLSSKDGPSSGDQWDLVGRLGAILLYDALGPLLTDMAEEES